MKLSVLKNKNIIDIRLPIKIEGTYWIYDIDTSGVKKNLISVQVENNEWTIESNSEIFILDNDNQYVNKIVLSEGNFYKLRNNVDDTIYIIFCTNTYNNFEYYNVSDILESGISFGSATTNTFMSNVLLDNSCVIKNENTNTMLHIQNEGINIYLNNNKINKIAEIYNGDIIFLNGIKILLINFDNSTYLGISKNYGNVTSSSKMSGKLPLNTNDIYDETSEDIEFLQYEEKDYFHKAPKFISKINELNIKIDNPPAKQDEQMSPLILTIGPMLTMACTSLIYGYTSVSNVVSGETTLKKALPTLMVSLVMIISVLVWPLITKRYERKTKLNKEKKRVEKYKKYIEEKITKILEEKEIQNNLLKNLYPTTEECANIIESKMVSLWQRRLGDDDFLFINVGIGTCDMKINIEYPEEGFSLEDDKLKDDFYKLFTRELTNIKNAPICISLKDNSSVAIVGKEEYTHKFWNNMLCQLLALHGYDELKLVILTDLEHKYYWKYLKTTPYLLFKDKKIRCFGENNDEYNEICHNLNQLFEQRKVSNTYDTHYLIITDCYKKIKNYEIFNNILDNNEQLGFSFIILDDNITHTPDQCKLFLDLMDGVKGNVIHNEDISKNVYFTYNINTVINLEKIGFILSNIPIELKQEEEGTLPTKLGFLEMYDVGKIEQLNSKARWDSSNPILNLSVPIGAGKNNEKIYIDLHEKYHGPHGLIAGMTGSGKSEVIITYILSMAVNFHPNEVQFILIDYKGGGLAGAFENELTGIKLPHLVGTITNLDANEIRRSLSSIESEIKRRQAYFNDAREKSGESTIDIYKYQRLFRNGIVTEPISHLFIICDEFAELKTQQPEFMEQLISTARIGRSLGIHLILATQKPSGVVDPQIWSNTKFRICMRVQDKSDSNEVIKCDDAAFLIQTGRFYFQVGFNEVYLLGQSAWAGGMYVPTEKVNKSIDTSIDFVNNIGLVYKNIETKEQKENNLPKYGEELGNIVKYLSELSKVENIFVKDLWLPKIPAEIFVDNLIKKYNFTKKDFEIEILVGEYDIPSRQLQLPLTIPFFKEGNLLLYGAAGSGKENFITSMIYSSIQQYSSEEINFYIIDFGSETLKMFDNFANVGDVISGYDSEKVANLYKMLIAQIEKRKKLFSSYNGDYTTYCKKSGNILPAIIVVINNYESYLESYEEYEELLNKLSREGVKYGIYFVLTIISPNGIRFKLQQNFGMSYVLQQNNNDDYITILGGVKNTFPAKCFGRGIMKTDDVYEFQTAMVCPKDNINDFIIEKSKEYISKFPIKASSIPVLPKVVSFENIKSEFNKDSELIIGIDKNELNIVKYNFKKHLINVISSQDIFNCNIFINSLINQILAVNRSNLIVINSENIDIDSQYQKYYHYFSSNVLDGYNCIKNILTNQNDNTQNICIIIGIDNFIKGLKGKIDIFDSIVENKINYIIVESAESLKSIVYESWYKQNASANNGIWIGNGVDEQYIINISNRSSELRYSITNDFCFVINRGQAKQVKYVSEFKLSVK